MNLRVRMVAAAEPYSPPRSKRSRGGATDPDYALRQVYFDGRFVPTRLYRREALNSCGTIQGPALITEYSSATVLPPWLQRTGGRVWQSAD